MEQWEPLLFRAHAHPHPALFFDILLPFTSRPSPLPLCRARCATAFSVSLMHRGAFSLEPAPAERDSCCVSALLCLALLPTFSHCPPLVFLLSISFQPILPEWYIQTHKHTHTHTISHPQTCIAYKAFQMNATPLDSSSCSRVTWLKKEVTTLVNNTQPVF